MDDKVTISDEALAQFSCWDSWDKTHTAFSSIARELLAFRRQAQEAPKADKVTDAIYEALDRAEGFLAQGIEHLGDADTYDAVALDFKRSLMGIHDAREKLPRRQAQEAPKVICKSCDFYEGCAQNVIELAKRYAAVVEAANVAKRFLESEDCEKGVYQREVLAAIDKSLFDLEAKPDDGKGE